MGTRRYDDFRIAITPRGDGSYDVVATCVDGTTSAGTFELPFADDELERSVLWIADTATRSTATREVGPADAAVIDAEHLGSALHDALLAGDIGTTYEAARARAAEQERGLRLILSLGDAPALLSVPWELLYRSPIFLASQRRTPLVRHLAVPEFPDPPAIDGAVHVLGVVSSPLGLAQLDVAAEKSRVEAAVAPMVESGRVVLDWLEPATPRRLREVLRDGVYHIVHYIGHSDFTAEGEGVLFLESADGAPAALDNTELANLLSDQSSLRLVVLNSCEGARTSLTDPFAGVATTLVQLGVPAVVAMQFSISDVAAILFAEELYTNLIGRQAPIDAAVSEARKAIYIEQRSVEWATPVLFLGNTDVELFEFRVTPAALPPPASTAEPESEVAVPATEPVTPTLGAAGRSRRGRVYGIVAGVAVAIAAVVGFLWFIGDDNDEPPVDATRATTQVTTQATTQVTSTVTTTPVTTVAGATAVPAEPSATVVIGEPAVANQEFVGELTAAEPTAEFTFEAPARAIVNLGSRIDTCTSQLYTLFAPSDTRVNVGLTCTDLGRHELVESGTYRLVVDGNGTPGAYDIVLTGVPPDVAEPVPPDGRATGELTTVGQRRIYTFDAAARESIGVQSAVDQCNSMTWSVLDPSGNRASTGLMCTDDPRIDLAASGAFELVVDSNGAVGLYDLTLIRIPTDVVSEVPSSGNMVGEIATIGARHTYRFDADAGSVVELTSETDSCASLVYTLRDANENALTTSMACSSAGEVTLPQTGRYAIDVDAVSGTGVYDLTLTFLP